MMKWNGVKSNDILWKDVERDGMANKNCDLIVNDHNKNIYIYLRALYEKPRRDHIAQDKKVQQSRYVTGWEN